MFIAGSQEFTAAKELTVRRVAANADHVECAIWDL